MFFFQFKVFLLTAFLYIRYLMLCCVHDSCNTHEKSKQRENLNVHTAQTQKSMLFEKLVKKHVNDMNMYYMYPKNIILYRKSRKKTEWSTMMIWWHHHSNTREWKKIFFEKKNICFKSYTIFRSFYFITVEVFGIHILLTEYKFIMRKCPLGLSKNRGKLVIYFQKAMREKKLDIIY